MENTNQREGAVKVSKLDSAKDQEQLKQPQIGLTRKQFLGIGAKAGLGLAIGWPKIVGNPKPEVTKPEINPETVALNHILSLPLGSSERRTNEETFVNRASTLEQVDRGFFAVADWQLRIKLLEKRWTIRETGHPFLQKLTPEEEGWAKKHKIHPEFLAICTDSYFKAREMLTQKMHSLGRKDFLKFYRPDLVAMVEPNKFPQEILDRVTADDLLPNPGIMVGVIIQETGAAKPNSIEPVFGGVNIGSGPAIKLLRNGANPKELEDAKEGLVNLFSDLNQLTKEGGPIQGLRYIVETVPGAPQTGESRISGGDVGFVQFRPNTAWWLHQFLKKEFKLHLHPSSLDAVTAAYLFLGMGLAWNDKAGKLQIRYGYINSASRKIDEIPHQEGLLGRIEKRAIEKWNEDLATKSLGWGRLYKAEIVDKGVFSKVSSEYQKKAA